MYVCIFIKLHITAQSGPVILVILCHSHWSFQGGINDTCYENLWSNATKGTHSLYLYKSYLSPEHLVLPRLSGLAATEPTLSFLHFFRFPPMPPPFPARRLQLFCGFLRFFASLPPSAILFSFPLSSSPFSSPLQSSLLSPFPSPFPSGVRLRVVPVPPRPLDRPRPRYRLRSHPRLQFRPRPRSLLPAPRIRLPPRTMRLYRRRALRMGPSGARKRHPLSAEMVTRAEWEYLL